MRLRRVHLWYALIPLIGIPALLFFFVHPSVDFTAVEFHHEFKDWKAANERYVGKSLSIRGRVHSVHHGGGMLVPHGWTTVTIGDGPSGVVCLFPTDVVYQTECLALGHEVVIRGECTGEIGGLPILSNCRLVEMNLPGTLANHWNGLK